MAIVLVTLALILMGMPSSHAVGSNDRPALTIPLPLGLPPVTLPGIGGSDSGGASPTPPTPLPVRVAPRRSNPFKGRAMWIWELPNSSGGDLAAIIATAKAHGVTTLLIKSSDGTDGWAQFNRPLLSTIRAAGLRVCAWQYVYGRAPADEARLGAGAVRLGAQCLVIDAESEYEGRYHAAQEYLSLLRQHVGASFPVGLAGFPWIDYHPAFPYSVFLGPGGAQYNLPQMYWKDIGTSVDDVFSHTYLYNRLYLRPIYPLGQLFSNPPTGQVIRFRQLADAYGARGLSWWDYQEATGSNWRAIGLAMARLAGFVPDPQIAVLSKGGKGDPVVWAQEHLYSAGDRIHIDGNFGNATLAAVETFQIAHGLPPTGVIDGPTWSALLKYQPAHVNWALHTNKRGIAKIAGAGTGPTPPPLSASLRGRNELHGNIGQGR